MYLDLFFVDDPITLYIDTFKTGKQAKPQIDIKVFYKANETDMTCLSGGEQDRVNLAFTLAFSDMYKGSVLLLDECISSLDTENYVNVMEVLNEKVKHKTIILVSHQANEGLFDTIITI
jgi:ABC-type cobalamin/Fe3+-siderophores transport system ATPase subunit